MNFYRWNAIDNDKIHVYGIEQGDSVSAITQTLRYRQLSSVSVRKLPVLRAGHLQKKRWLLAFLNRWVALTQAGYDQLQAFITMQRQSSYQQEAQALQSICQSIQAGLAVSVAMASYADLFPGTVRQQVAVAEQTGQYNRILPAVASTLDSQIQQQEELQQQLRYPITVLCVAFILMAAMQIWILPAFANVYAQMNIPLPALTEAVLSFSGARGTRIFLLLSALILAAFLTGRWVVRHGFQYQFLCSLTYAAAPDLLLRYRHLLRDLETLQNNLVAGIPLAQSCVLTSRYSTSQLWSLAWLQASVDIQRGIPLHRALGRHPLPAFLSDYIETGELTGQLPEQLNLAITQLKYGCDSQLRLLCKAIPGVMLGLVAALALTILLAVYVPLFQLGGWVG